MVLQKFLTSKSDPKTKQLMTGEAQTKKILPNLCATLLDKTKIEPVDIGVCIMTATVYIYS